jgi:hypothetical protein
MRGDLMTADMQDVTDDVVARVRARGYAWGVPRAFLPDRELMFEVEGILMAPGDVLDVAAGRATPWEVRDRKARPELIE